MSRARPGARNFLIFGGIVYAVLWIYGLIIDQGSAANFVPINTPDNWVHLVLAIGMGRPRSATRTRHRRPHLHLIIPAATAQLDNSLAHGHRRVRATSGGLHDPPTGNATIHGRSGDLRRAYHEGMEDQLGALGLVLNCITLWTPPTSTPPSPNCAPIATRSAMRTSCGSRPTCADTSTCTGTTRSSSPTSPVTRRALRDPDASDDEDR